MKKLQKMDWIWAGGFCILLAFVLYKCRFGFGYADESFYLTIPYRLAQGDALIVSEWQVSQLASVLLYPFMKLYLLLWDSREGMLLTFRYLFTALHSITALFLYLRLRKHGFAACLVSLVYLVFTPFGIMALSYNSMGLGLLTCACVLLYSGSLDSPWEFFFSGLLFAGAVLCCPYLALVYLLYSIGYWLCRLKKQEGIPQPRCFWAFTGGCAAAAAAFLAFVFSRSSLSDILQALPMIFLDPEHPSRSFLGILWDYASAVLVETQLSPLYYLAAALAILALCLDKNRSRHQPLFFLAGLVLSAWQLFHFWKPDTMVNFYMLPPVLLGLVCLLLKPRTFLREGLLLWLPGILYGFCLSWSSNTRLYVIANAAAIAAIGSILMALSFCQLPTGMPKKLCRSFCTVFLCFLLAGTTWGRWNGLFDEWGLTMADMDTEITFGVQKGLHSAEIRKILYEERYQDSAAVRESSCQRVLYYSPCPWLYLEDDKENASYSAWNKFCDENAAARLIAYYTLDPSRMPDIVYGEKESWAASPSLAAFFLEQGYQQQETKLAYQFLAPKP